MQAFNGAFNGDQALKDEMVARIRQQWADGRLVTAAALRWDSEIDLYSLNGALAETADADQFVARTGIPLELALLCESTLALNAITIPDKSTKIGLTLIHDPALDAAVSEWLAAIRPGADLDGVVPKFMVWFLGFVLSDAFPQRAFITPEVRSAAGKILAHWQSELAGQAVDAKAWRQVRGEAVKATEHISEAWAYPISYFVETMAWPLSSMVKEFSQPFMFLTGNLLSFLQAPYQVEADRQLSELALKGHLKSHEMRRDGKDAPGDFEAMLEANPDIKEAMSWPADEARNARMKAGQRKAFTATTPLVQQFMDQWVRFIGEA